MEHLNGCYRLNIDGIKTVEDCKHVLKLLDSALCIGVNKHGDVATVKKMQHLLIIPERDGFYPIRIRQYKKDGTMLTYERLVPTHNGGVAISEAEATRQMLYEIESFTDEEKEALGHCEIRDQFNQLLYHQHKLALL